jgi:hypothetical protein
MSERESENQPWKEFEFDPNQIQEERPETRKKKGGSPVQMDINGQIIGPRRSFFGQIVNDFLKSEKS